MTNDIEKFLSDTVEYAVKQTEADRVLIAYEEVAKSHGFKGFQGLNAGAELSLDMLQQFVKNQRSVLVKDYRTDPNFNERVSALLSDLGSALFIPIFNEYKFMRGFLYLDQTGRSTFRSSGFLDRVERHVRNVLEPKLHSPREHLKWEDLERLSWS